jgi:hypothetical protein
LKFPPFASSLVFELYQHQEGERVTHHTIKVNYNGEHRKMPFCGNGKECRFEDFVRWYERWRVQDIRATCGAQDYYTKESLILLASAIVGLLLTYGLVLLLRKLAIVQQ